MPVHKILGNINEYNPDNHHMLIYGHDQHCIHVIDAQSNNIIREFKFDDDMDVNFISSSVVCADYIYWIIFDTQQQVHTLVIDSKGTIILEKKSGSADPGNTLISIHRIGYHKFVMYYINKRNIIKQQHITYHSLPPNQTIIGCRTAKYNCADINYNPTLPIEVKYIANLTYITRNNKIYTIDKKFNLTQMADYPRDRIYVTNLYNNNEYSYSKCLNTLYKNNKAIHKFKKLKCMFQTLDKTDSNQIVISFVSPNKITHLIDNNGSITKQKFHINNIKFVNDTEIPSIFIFKNTIKSNIITFMIANKLSPIKIPKLLLYQIIHLTI